jgi:replicative DNA helicase
MQPAAPASFERTPPQDLAAEQCVLGAMMLSKDAIADVVERLREEDFYTPAHQSVFRIVLDLYARGEPADAITVSAGLMASGELQRIGGAPYLHTLVASPPLTANASYYAQIVRDASMRRRLVEVGSRIVQTGYAGEGEVEELINRAQAEVYEITQRTTAEDYAPLSDLLDGVYTELESIQNHTGDIIGIPTGFIDLDKLTNGLHPGQMIVVAARPAMGKSTLGLDFARQHQERVDQRDLQPGNEPQRDRDASAERAGRVATSPHAFGLAQRAAVDPDGQHHVGGVQRATVHRRLPQHVDDGDPCEVPPAQAAA